MTEFIYMELAKQEAINPFNIGLRNYRRQLRYVVNNAGKESTARRALAMREAMWLLDDHRLPFDARRTWVDKFTQGH